MPSHIVPLDRLKRSQAPEEFNIEYENLLDLKVTSKDAEGYIMSLEHTTYDVKGVQYHPESVLTPEGAKIIGNWLKN
jgi:anthranilate/para-aminobenzoate synthase component II